MRKEEMRVAASRGEISMVSMTPEKYALAIARISDPLLKDLALAMDRLGGANDRFVADPGPEGLFEIAFWARATVASLFGHMDAVGTMARRAAVHLADTGQAQVAEAEHASLREKRIKNGAELEAFLDPTSSFKLGLKVLPPMLGLSFQLPVEGEGWQAIKDLWKARRRFTHPRHLEDFYAMDALGSLEAGLVWYFGQMQLFLAQCSQSDLSVSVPPPKVRRKTGLAPKGAFTKEELRDLVSASAGATLRYQRVFSELMAKDRERANAILVGPTSSNEEAAFVRRVYLRVQCTNIEAQLSVLQFLAAAAVERGEFTPHAGQGPGSSSLPAPVAALVSLAGEWSKAFGLGAAIQISPVNRNRLRDAWACRDRLTHPRAPGHVETNQLEVLNYSLAFADLHLQLLTCLEYDIEKLVEIERSRERRETPEAPTER